MRNTISTSVRNYRNSTRSTRQDGYTLIELAVSFAVIGFLLAGFLSAYNLYIQNQVRIETENNVSGVTAALTNFLVQKGRYPCPARINALRTDVDYGLEGICDATDPGYPVVTTAGTCNGGYCYEEGEGVVDIDPAPPPAVPVNITPVVRRGAVPFRVLGLTEEEAEDGYGNRLQYAVTENLTTTSTYIPVSGGIKIVDTAGNSLLQDAAGATAYAHYALFSTGRDGAGAYSHEGVPVHPCGNGEDSENCNTSPANDVAIYALAPYSLTTDANHYDDFLKFYSTVEQPLWRIADASGFHIRDLVDAEAGGRIGIGTSTPATTLDIVSTTAMGTTSGGVLADGGDLYIDDICDPGGLNCFNVGAFGGDSPSFECGVGQYAVGFESGSIKCMLLTDYENVCPGGGFMRGLNADGTPVCESVIGCPSQNVQLCYDSGTGTYDIYNLPATIAVDEQWTAVSGISYQQRWECRNDGQWHYETSTGICDCNAQDYTWERSCNSYISGSSQWTGSLTYRFQRFCPSNTTSNTLLDDPEVECICNDYTWNDTDPCPSGQSGTIYEERYWTCEDSGGSPCTNYQSDGSCGQMSGWIETSNTCACSPSSQTDTDPCPIGYSGSVTNQRDYECPAGAWTSWYEVSNTCTCTGASETRTVGCTPPLVGNKTELREYNCTTDSWDPWTEIANNCGAVTYSWRAKSSANGPFGGGLSTEVGDTCSTPGSQTACSAPASGGQHWHYDVCECE